MDTETIISIGYSLITTLVAIASLVSNVKARKFAELRYAVTELSNFKMLSDFVKQLKELETVLLLETKSPIEQWRIEPQENRARLSQ
jgi:hypothetical protein